MFLVFLVLQVDISVGVTLRDVNDNAPQFDKDHYYTDLGEVIEVIRACACTCT